MGADKLAEIQLGHLAFFINTLFPISAADFDLNVFNASLAFDALKNAIIFNWSNSVGNVFKLNESRLQVIPWSNDLRVCVVFCFFF